MQLKSEQLPAALAKGLAPVYFIAGDEPLQVGEAADAIRATARQAGFSAREIFSLDSHFSWSQLTQSADERSIFADKKIIDLRLTTHSPGTDGAKTLIHYCERLPDDTLLLITGGKLSKEAMKSKWLQALDKAGVVIQVWPLEGQDLLRWLQQRLQKRGLQTDIEGVKILASRIEGNLLAAAQEIEKLYVLYGSGTISSQQIVAVVADSSRYDVFKLMDSVLAAKVKRAVKILAGLKVEGTAPPVIVWALLREARTLAKIKHALTQGHSLDMALKSQQVWDKRRQLVTDAVRRLSEQDLNTILIVSAKADRQSKGQQSGDVWETLMTLCLLFAAVHVLSVTR